MGPAVVKAARHLLIDAQGRQHVLFRSDDETLVLTVTGANLAIGPVQLTFVIEGVGAIEPATRTLAALRGFLSPTTTARTRVRRPSWTQIQLRNALIALDGDQAGASHRDVAAVIYGADTIAKRWREDRDVLRSQMQRALRRGEKLRDVGYRNLIRASQR